MLHKYLHAITKDISWVFFTNLLLLSTLGTCTLFVSKKKVLQKVNTL